MALGVIALARPTFDVDYAEEVAAAARAVIEDIAPGYVGGQELLFDATSTRAAIDDLRGRSLDGLLVLQATFTDATMTRELATAVDAPLILWAFPEERTGGRLRLNSLCGINLAAHALGRIGRAFRYMYHHADDPRAAAELTRLLQGHGSVDTRLLQRGGSVESAVRIVPGAVELSASALEAALQVEEALDGLTTGLVGDYPDGFDPCRYDAGAVQRLLGVTVDRVELADLFAAADEVGPDAVAETRERAALALGPLDELDQESLEASLRIYGGLRSLAARRQWSAVATRCWPECFTEYGGAACAPQAMLTDDGIPGMCEADVYGNLTSLILRELSGDAPFIADLVDIDEASDSAVLWHCGLAPLNMACADTDPAPTVHSNRGKPLLHEFALRPGRVTIARLSQAGDVHKLVVGGGEMLAEPLPFSGTAGTVRFDKPAGDVLATIMAEGLEHHYGVVYGDYEEELRALAARWSLPVVNLT
ncbi:MAG: fucose isomerase [Acidimicrobiia bacterium]|nr:fucose isomerase [Acidimicrobiia bacterium]